MYDLFSRNLVITREHAMRNARWTRPEQRVIKINCDAAVNQNKSYVAIVAREWGGTLVCPMSKRVEIIIPLQAEAEAINWATQQALKLDAYSVIVESVHSDAKVCAEAIQKQNRDDTIRLAHLSQNINFN